MITVPTLAVDIGGTYIKFGRVLPGGEIEKRHKLPTKEFGTIAELFAYICSGLEGLGQAGCIGVSAPGLVDAQHTVRSYAAPKLAALYGADIRAELEKRTGLPTAALNDARAAGLCELKLGRARGTKLSAYLILGTGGGGCFCTEHDVFAGADNFAGEFHFLSYHDNASGEDIKTGRTIGMMGLVNCYNAQAGEGRAVALGEEVIQCAFGGQAQAVQAVDEWIHRIALQCLNIAVIINPELLCIGGGISEEDWFMQRVKAEYEAICDSHFNGVHFLSMEIDRCAFRNDANLLGAALRANALYAGQL